MNNYIVSYPANIEVYMGPQVQEGYNCGSPVAYGLSPVYQGYGGMNFGNDVGIKSASDSTSQGSYCNKRYACTFSLRTCNLTTFL